jgi:hypothetical protein
MDLHLKQSRMRHKTPFKFRNLRLKFVHTKSCCIESVGIRLSTIDLFRYPIEHGCNQIIGTKKKTQKPHD